MDMKLVAGTVLLLVGAFVLTSCRFAEIAFYEHEPSKRFYKSLDFSVEELSSFKSSDILFVVNLKQVNPEDYIAWLGLYTQSPGRSVFVNEANISGIDWELEEAINVNSNLDLVVENTNLMKASIKLFEIKGDLLQKALNGSDALTLEVDYSINNLPGTMSFKLIHRVEKYSIFST